MVIGMGENGVLLLCQRCYCAGVSCGVFMSMRPLMVRVVVVFAIITLVSACDRVELKEGEYEVEVRLQLPNLEGAGVLSRAKICVQQRAENMSYGLVVLSQNNPLQTCPISNVKQSGAKLRFDIICPGKNKARAQANYRLQAERFSGRIDMNMGGKNMTMFETQYGYRVGDCKPAS